MESGADQRPPDSMPGFSFSSRFSSLFRRFFAQEYFK